MSATNMLPKLIRQNVLKQMMAVLTLQASSGYSFSYVKSSASALQNNNYITTEML